jgi:DNA-binding Lrp family transcriptional regulator
MNSERIKKLERTGIIEKYVATFETSQLKRFEFHPGKATFSDIIWAIK